MKTVCPHCKQKYEVEDDYRDQEMTCVRCNQQFMIIPSRTCSDCGAENVAKHVKCYRGHNAKRYHRKDVMD